MTLLLCLRTLVPMQGGLVDILQIARSQLVQDGPLRRSDCVVQHEPMQIPGALSS